jgi:hypothetical protein
MFSVIADRRSSSSGDPPDSVALSTASSFMIRKVYHAPLRHLWH